jgi:hypothetical protein
MKIFKTTAIALMSGLLISAASMPAGSATGKDQVMIAENMPTKGGAPSSLGVPSPVEQARTAFVSPRNQPNCRPSHLYTDGVVGDPDSCIMGDILSVGSHGSGVAGR